MPSSSTQSGESTRRTGRRSASRNAFDWPPGCPTCRCRCWGCCRSPWPATPAAFRAGRGFLVGDAAHRMTPIGGMGMNVAIHDGHNLGWKLAWAVRGWAGETLLDSYEQERRPVGLRYTLPCCTAARRSRTRRPGRPVRLGCAPHAAHPGWPRRAGRRAPHVWVEQRGRRVSTLDLFDDQLTVLIGRRGRTWSRIAARLATTGLPITVHTLGQDLRDPDGELTDRYALRPARPCSSARTATSPGGARKPRRCPGRWLLRWVGSTSRSSSPDKQQCKQPTWTSSESFAAIGRARGREAVLNGECRLRPQVRRGRLAR